MINRNLCPEIHYRKSLKGIILTGCYGVDGQIVLPDEINGAPIVEIAPYAFSDTKESEDDQIFLSEYASFYQNRKRLKTTDISEVRLPFGVREIGKYAFYRCRNLEKLILSDEIKEIGGGALTGCRGIREVEIHFRKGEQSALKSILDEVRFQIHAKLYMKDAMADILFPEHYEEAVEDTPAKQLFTRYHGSGGDYRQCFYNRELDYKKYDELLYRAAAEDTVETVTKMAIGRLRYPYKLSETAKSSYMKYLKNHLGEVLETLVKNEDMDSLSYLSGIKFFIRVNDSKETAGENKYVEEALIRAIEYASEQKKTDILSFLMDEKRKNFPKKKKSFDL